MKDKPTKTFRNGDIVFASHRDSDCVTEVL